jgi:glycosyltransferase involved in cell wall biosynthesis
MEPIDILRMSEGPLVLHDFFNYPDGGGRVAKILAESFQAQLWTGHLDRESFPKGYFGNVEPGSLKAYENSPWWVGFSKIFQLWWAFAHFPERTVPWAIFSGTFSPLAHRKISGKKILYCHTPPRLLYDQKNFMVQQIPVWQRPLLKMVMGLYLPAYEQATHGMDVIVTNSETVKERIRRFLGQDSQVIHPPCETEKFRFVNQENFYLSTARLDPLKRIDVIVRAFLKMPEKNLVVVSGGSEIRKIKEAAEEAKNIQVLGWVNEERLIGLMGKCIASIYIPRDEDYGMSPVESMAAGKPVIGVQEGGLLETIGEGRGQSIEDRGRKTEGGRRRGRDLLITDCGVLVPEEPGVEDVIEAVEWMTPQRALGMREACEERANKFDKNVFIEKMREVIERR